MHSAPIRAARRGRRAMASSGPIPIVRSGVGRRAQAVVLGGRPDEAQAELLVLARLRAATAPRASGRCPTGSSGRP